jgi:glycosyltransferase involved in cell wall biosynthesis
MAEAGAPGLAGMKVVLVTSIERGGPIEQVMQLSRGLTRAGCSVLVTCANAQLAERFAVDGVRAEIAPLTYPADIRGAARVWKLARGAEVIHGHDRRAGLWTRIGPRPSRRGIRVYTVHGLPEPYYPPPLGPEHPGLRASLRYRGLDARLCARCDAIVVPSRTIAEAMVDRVSFPRQKVVVVPNGIEAPPFAPGGGDLIGTLSVIEPVKAIEVFLQAISRLAGRHPDWRFVVNGAGSDAKRLQSLAHDMGLDERLSWPGFVNPSDALGRLGVYVICSYSENAPLALLEAMAGGVPVVATCVGGIPEIVDESVGLLVAPGDPDALAQAIEHTCAEPSATDARVLAARRRIEERYTAERNASAHAALYERLLAVLRADAATAEA